MNSSQIVLVEGLVILVIVLAIAVHQLWSVRRSWKVLDKPGADTPEWTRGAGSANAVALV